MQSNAAQSIVCVSCGGHIPLTGLHPSVMCPFCGTVQEISHAQRTELARYRSGVQSELERAEHERSQVRKWDRWYGGRGGQAKAGFGTTMVLFASVLVLAIALAGVAQVMMTSGNPALAAAALFVAPIGVLVIFVPAVIGYSVWYCGGKRRERATNTPLGSLATCPACGAVNSLAVGRVLERCAYCGAALMPSPALMARGLDEAENVRLRAELERYRTERRGMATLIRSSAGTVVPYFVLGSFLPLTLGGAIVFTVGAVSSGRPEPGLGILWGMAALNGGAMWLVHVHRRAWRERFARIAELGRAPFGQRPLGFDGFIGWLNAHWAGPVPLTEIFPGTYFHAVSLVLGEYPGLLVLNPKPLAEEYPGYVAVYLAAWIPAVHANPSLDPSTTTPQRAWLESLGISVSMDRGGLKAHGKARVARCLAQRVDGAEILAQVASCLLGMARSMSAMPVQLPPE